MEAPKTIAIDGPVAAGKTALGKALAEKLGYRFLDTGLMYRAVSWLAIQQGAGADNEGAVMRIAQTCPIRPIGDDGASMVIGEQILGEELRHPAVDLASSQVSTYQGVRSALVKQQKQIADEGPVVMAGRDIGTVVLPDAPLKLFIVASPEVRARRRYEEMRDLGKEVEFQEVLDDLLARDHRDESRDASPLKAAPDAVVLDTDGKTLCQVVQHALRIAEGVQ
ncbi:MAG: (d)CMP kinase [Dehalococcoidia bacterium]|nr:(d)CMP kinase [Dehalococcoidia bacterium]